MPRALPGSAGRPRDFTSGPLIEGAAMILFARRLGWLSLASASIAAALLLAPAPVGAAPTTPPRTTTDPAEAAAGWLAQQFVDSSHKPSPSGDHFETKFAGQYYFDGGDTAGGIWALAAAKAGRAKIDAAITYLGKHVDEYADLRKAQGGPYDGSVAKTAVAAIVAGADPRHFGGFDLIQTLKDDECPAGSPACTPGAAANIFSSISESLVIIAEARVGGAFAPSSAALDYLLSLQCPDGGFTANTDTKSGCTSDLDSTSYAAAALFAARGHDGAMAKAVGFLASERSADGSWSRNVNSTGLAASVLAAQGRDVSASRAWLAKQQVTVGVTIGATATRGALKFNGRYNPTSSLLATNDALLGMAPNAFLATLTDAGATLDAPVLAPTASVAHASVAQGGRETVTGIGFSAGEAVRATADSPAVALAEAKAGSDGTAAETFTVPADLAPGQHTVELAGTQSRLTVEQTFTVAAAPPASSSAPATGTTGSGSPTATPATASTVASTPVTTTPLAATGTSGRSLVWQSAVGLGLIVAGGLAVAAGRRRRT